MRKPFLALAAILMLLLPLAGCGGELGPSDDNPFVGIYEGSFETSEPGLADPTNAGGIFMTISVTGGVSTNFGDDLTALTTLIGKVDNAGTFTGELDTPGLTFPIHGTFQLVGENVVADLEHKVGSKTVRTILNLNPR